MKRFFLCLVVMCTTISSLFARTESKGVQSSITESNVNSVSSSSGTGTKADSTRSHHLKDVLVIGNRAGSKTPVAQTNLNADAIQSLTVANNLPHVLWMTPSLVATSENGTASGNTSFRIRGTDANRINITLNGIPLNDPESQEVYWVDLPGMTSALQSIQVQRGVGISTNGTGSFGASINMTTKDPGQDSYVESATTVGSYGTFQQNIAFGTGLFGNGCSLDMRYSNLTTDGYIRNGWCKHQSFFATFDKRFKTSDLRINYIYGNEHTGITWEGISEEEMKNDPKYNPAGEISDGIYYNNQSDNYRQQYLQVFYSKELNKNLLLNTGLNYTNGFGYYEEYQKNQTFSSLNIPTQTIGSIIHDTSDIVTQKYMRNDFYAANLNLQYEKNGLNLRVGSMFTYYDGDHYGKLAWAEYNQDIPVGQEWVRNNGKKTDANVFAKAEYSLLKNLNAYLDLQYRYVNYTLKGIDDDDMSDLTQNRTWNFFNPKAGIFYQINAFQKIFASVAVAHREPARADIKDEFKNGNATKIEAEQLIDYELGYSYDNQKYMVSSNLYYMDYKNQLVPTGKLNDAGYKLMSNVPRSYRLGMELTVGLRPLSWLQLDANTALSKNEVVDYTVWYDTYDNSTDWNLLTNQKSQYFKKAKLPFSPEMVSAIGLSIIPAKNFALSLTEKQVGKQYITNTQNDDLTLPAYNTTNASLTYNFKIKDFAHAELGFYINNIFSNSYSCNGWGYEAHFANGDPTYTEKGLYPVAPINYLTKFTVRF